MFTTRPRVVAAPRPVRGPTSPWSRDQTELFGKKKWVSFAFTPAQVQNARISQATVTTPR